MPSDAFRWEVDPRAIEASLRTLRERIRAAVDQGRHTKVRFSYKGRQLMPDLPLGGVLAAEGLSLALLGPLQVLLVNLGVKAFIEVELVHEASERVREGEDLFSAGEVDAAEQKYREALLMKPDDGAALYRLGVLLRVTGRRDEAIVAFEKVAAMTDHPDQAKSIEALSRMNRGGRSL